MKQNVFFTLLVFLMASSSQAFEIDLTLAEFKISPSRNILSTIYRETKSGFLNSQSERKSIKLNVSKKGPSDYTISYNEKIQNDDTLEIVAQISETSFMPVMYVHFVDAKLSKIPANGIPFTSLSSIKCYHIGNCTIKNSKNNDVSLTTSLIYAYTDEKSIVKLNFENKK